MKLKPFDPTPILYRLQFVPFLKDDKSFKPKDGNLILFHNYNGILEKLKELGYDKVDFKVILSFPEKTINYYYWDNISETEENCVTIHSINNNQYLINNLTGVNSTFLQNPTALGLSKGYGFKVDDYESMIEFLKLDEFRRIVYLARQKTLFKNVVKT